MTRHRSTVVVALVALVGSLLGAGAHATPASAQQRRVVVLGDSIILGAQGPMTAAFRDRGWDVTFDATVSRSTAAAVSALEAHRPALTDTLVLSFGANDAGNTAAFRQRVEQLLDAAGGVPNVYWLTIREVRGYYAPANQVLREVAAGRPNVSVLDWHAATAGNPSFTAGDGLHLNGAGAALMTSLVVDAVVSGQVLPTAAPPPPALPPPPEPAPGAEATPTTDVPTTTAGVATTASTTTASTTTASTTPAETTTTEPFGVEERAGAFDSVDTASTVGGGLALVLAALLLGGVVLAVWSLVVARRRAGAAPPSEQHPAVRSHRRAERIAAARAEVEGGD